MSSFSDYVLQIQTWLTKVSQSNAELSTERPWCTLDIEDTTQAGLRDYFDRTDLSEEFVSAHEDESKSTPYTFLQNESDLVYSLHKCMVARHKGRLMHYRDDCSQKDVRVYSAISIGLAKYLGTKEAAITGGK